MPLLCPMLLYSLIIITCLLFSSFHVLAFFFFNIKIFSTFKNKMCVGCPRSSTSGYKQFVKVSFFFLMNKTNFYLGKSTLTFYNLCGLQNFHELRGLIKVNCLIPALGLQNRLRANLDLMDTIFLLLGLHTLFTVTIVVRTHRPSLTMDTFPLTQTM